MRRGHTRAPATRLLPASSSSGCITAPRRPGKARCLRFLPSTAINVLRALARGFHAPRGQRAPSGGPRVTGPGRRLFFLDGGLLGSVALQTFGDRTAGFTAPSRRPASAQAPFRGEASELGTWRDCRPWPLRGTQALAAA